MKFHYNKKKISGILAVLPETEYSFEDMLRTESVSRVRRMKKIMGFDKRRIVADKTTVGDMHTYAVRYLVDEGLIEPDDIGGIVVITQTPDFYIPQVSEIIQGEIGLSDEVMCMDIPQGCAGYPVGLIESFSLLEHMENKKVLLCTGDIFNRVISGKRDEPVFGGDAAAVTVIENDNSFGDSYFRYYSDGKQGESLVMREGAFFKPLYPEDKGGSYGISMDGSDVFNFIMRDVPGLVDETLSDAGLTDDDIEYYFFHQPNKYILQKLAKRMGVDPEKMPMQIVEKYGNSNSSTIPVVIADGFSDEMTSDRYNCCVSGFGEGLTWVAGTMQIGEMDFCRLIEAKL